MSAAIVDFSGLTADNLKRIVDDYEAALVAMNDARAVLTDPTWETFMQPQINLEASFASRKALFVMSQFYPDRTIRDVCNEQETRMIQFETDQKMRRDVYTVLNHYYRTERADLTFEQHRYVEKMVLEARMYGLHLPDAAYDRVKDIKKRLTHLSAEYEANLANCNTTFEMTDAELTGMPDAWKASRLQVDGTYKVSLKYPCYFPIMEYCSNRETRRRILHAFDSRCAATNLPLAEETFALRHEMAKLFGFECYSDYQLQTRMAKTTETVMKFLTDLSAKSEPLLRSDLATMLALASEDGLTEVARHDYQYYLRIHESRTCDLDREALKRHFPLDVVKRGMFKIYETLLGFTFIDVTEANRSTFWHEDVEVYNVIDTATGTHVGQFYLDLFPRDGKFGHCAVWPAVRRTATPGVCIMACNFPKGENMSFRFVKTFFHEFGHIMHNMSAETTIAALAGTLCERDAVELPSQQLEEWCYCAESLRMMSIDMSDETIEKLQKSRDLMQGYYIRRQLTYGLFDMVVHGSNVVKDIVGTYARINKEQTTIDQPAGTCFPASFAHIMGSYSAGFYGYLWSKVYAVDVFETRFKGHELDPVVGMQFRKQLLRWGAVRDTSESLVEFLGREPSGDAYMRRLGSATLA